MRRVHLTVASLAMVVVSTLACRSTPRPDEVQDDPAVMADYMRPCIHDSIRRFAQDHGEPFHVTYDGWNTGYENELGKPYQIHLTARNGTRISWRTHDHGSFASDREYLYRLEYNPDRSTSQHTRVSATDLETGEASWTTVSTL